MDPCPSPKSYTGLSEGSHRFAVRAVNAGGSSSPAVVNWIVDTTAPTVQIDSGPSGTVHDPSASFTFSSDDASARLRCRLDGAMAENCSSPKDYSDLGNGSHRFVVRAIDWAGNRSTAAITNWTVAP